MEEITAFLIHKRDYQNTSELLDFLTDEYGLLRIIAKASKTQKTKMQPFTRLRIQPMGKNALKTLKDWHNNDYFREYSPRNILLLSYINELIAKLVNEHSLEICAEYYYLLTHLNEDEHNNEWLLRIFENHLLAELGYGIDFNVTISGDDISSTEYYYFINHQGFAKSNTCEISGADLLAFAQNRLPSAEGLKYYKKMNRLRIDTLLGGRKLASRALFQAFNTQNLWW